MLSPVLTLPLARNYPDFARMTCTKHIEELCQAISQEADGEKLISLVDQLNQELEEASGSDAKDVAQSAESSVRKQSRPKAA